MCIRDRVDFEYTTVHKTVEYGRGGRGALQQFGFGDFFYISSAEVAEMCIRDRL